MIMMIGMEKERENIANGLKKLETYMKIWRVTNEIYITNIGKKRNIR